MTKQIILNSEKLETRFSLLKDGKLEEYQLERQDDKPDSGAIYLGRIVNLEPSLQAAFVDIGVGRNAFLHYKDMLPASYEMVDRIAAEEKAQLKKQNLRPAAKPAAKKANKEKRFSQRIREMINLSKKTENEPEIAKKERKRRHNKISLKNIPEMFPAGSEVIVQVVKEPIGTKGARVSTNISIAGRYLVLLPYSDHIGLSSKIENKTERKRLRKILANLDMPESMGLICRTVGEGRKSVFFERDLDMLLDHWHKVETALKKPKAPSKLYSPPNLVESSIRDFLTEDIDRIIVDNQNDYRNIQSSLSKFGGRRLAGKVSYYKGDKPIFEHYKIKDQLNNIFQREVPLPGGGYLCVDETEALIAIDVNSGGRNHNSQEEMILETNMDAAAEVARQLRLRNVGGLVVIDFIDMRSAGNREKVYKEMKKLIKDDRAKTRILPISRLGLMEMTRQRAHESIKDTVFDLCSYCSGSGRIKSSLTMSVEIQRRLQFILKKYRSPKLELRVVVHPNVLSRLRNKDHQLLDEMETQYGKQLSFRADPALHSEDFKIIDPKTNTEY